MARFLPTLLCIAPAYGYMYDTLISAPMQAPSVCQHGCARWSDLKSSFSTASQPAVDKLWVSAASQAAAGSSCAMPGNLGVPQGASCYCAGTAAAPTSAWGWCSEPAVPYPQQLNLQYGASGAELQVAFVTADRGAQQVGQPLVELCSLDSGSCLNVTGHTERMLEPQTTSRILSFSFVPLPPSWTMPGANLTYRALPATDPAAWSAVQQLSIPPATAVQRFALFGDQGVYPYSNIGNLMDHQAGGDISSIILLGDLAYNLGMDNGTRGDGYLYAMEPVLSHIPWITLIGNHGECLPLQAPHLHVQEISLTALHPHPHPCPQSWRAHLLALIALTQSTARGATSTSLRASWWQARTAAVAPASTFPWMWV
jgi:hypothetical protein